MFYFYLEHFYLLLHHFCSTNSFWSISLSTYMHLYLLKFSNFLHIFYWFSLLRDYLLLILVIFYWFSSVLCKFSCIFQSFSTDSSLYFAPDFHGSKNFLLIFIAQSHFHGSCWPALRVHQELLPFASLAPSAAQRLQLALLQRDLTERADLARRRLNAVAHGAMRIASSGAQRCRRQRGGWGHCHGGEDIMDIYGSISVDYLIC